jgi:hypothetical protein
MTTEGGEVAFVLSVMADSLVLKNRYEHHFLILSLPQSVLELVGTLV